MYFAKEPTVDIVIINWNYARFVGDAIKSVKEQSYENIRCLIIDNGSDDGSEQIIATAIGDDPKFTFFRLPDNLGHLGGALWALKHASSEFVVFLDADDVLFPDYIASHLQVHLATGASVGFTCSNCIDINANGDLLTSGNYCMYGAWQTGTPALRPIERTVRLKEVDDGAYTSLADASRYMPAHITAWFWCPGSSNMFRRALFDRVLPDGPSPALFGGVDGFFLPILHALTGSILIDLPLSAYRVHGSNDYSTMPSLHGIYSSQPKGNAQQHITYLRMMTWLVEHFEDVMLMTGETRYWQILNTAMGTDPSSREAFSDPQFQAGLAKCYPRLVGLYGEMRVFSQLRRYMGFSEYLKVVLASGRFRFAFAAIGRAFSLEIARRVWRLYKTVSPKQIA